MQDSHSLDSVQKTLRDLHSVFVWGERVVPFLEEMIVFIESITPLIGEINRSLNESEKRFPSAQSQLNDVTRATELATNEILGLLETSLSDFDTLDTKNKTCQEHVDQFGELTKSLRSEIRAALSESDSRVYVLHAKLWHQADKLEKRLSESFNTNEEVIHSLRTNLNQILMSLQVQDITTQQISAVNHVMQSIKEQLSGLLVRLNQIKKIETPVFSLDGNREAQYERLKEEFEQKAEAGSTHVPIPDEEAREEGVFEGNGTFDANATFDKQKARRRQEDADEVFDRANDEPPPAPGTDAPGDCDEPAAEQAAVPHVQDEQPGPEEGVPVETFVQAGESPSNDDIDRLFDSREGAPSNDEIDKLFGA